MKSTKKELEEIRIRQLKRLIEQEKLIRKMRMSLYYVNRFLDEVIAEIDGMWFHGLDGSDLIVSKDELWDVLQGRVIPKIKHGRKVVDEPLKELKKHIGW
jgi:hypothetical protein